LPRRLRVLLRLDEKKLIEENIFMTEKRKNVRYQTVAKARIKGAGTGEILVKNISITGCCVECTTYTDIKLNNKYKLEVQPENAAHIGKFEFMVYSRWIRTGDYACEIGFTIVESPKGKSFERYVVYLSWRYSQGNSMT
jgi:hypothetical protein